MVIFSSQAAAAQQARAYRVHVLGGAGGDNNNQRAALLDEAAAADGAGIDALERRHQLAMPALRFLLALLTSLPVKKSVCSTQAYS